jgi:hypothetical protein
VLDAVRLGPADDATAVTAQQPRAVLERLVTAGHWRPGDPDIVIVADTGPLVLVGRDRQSREPGVHQTVTAPCRNATSVQCRR